MSLKGDLSPERADLFEPDAATGPDAEAPGLSEAECGATIMPVGSGGEGGSGGKGDEGPKTANPQVRAGVPRDLSAPLVKS